MRHEIFALGGSKSEMESNRQVSSDEFQNLEISQTFLYRNKREIVIVEQVFTKVAIDIKEKFTKSVFELRNRSLLFPSENLLNVVIVAFYKGNL